ncbi:MAG TPA: hypothetical protein VFE62_01965, partial [Gemmataceae bacterium]|nr:hypothetical protein [Gemmataceae bacterium]
MTEVAKKPASSQQNSVSAPPQPTNGQPLGELAEKKSSIDNCLKVLAGVQEQIRFADTKAAFVFAINTLMFGFVIGTVGALKKALAFNPVPAPAYVGLL